MNNTNPNQYLKQYRSGKIKLEQEMSDHFMESKITFAAKLSKNLKGSNNWFFSRIGNNVKIEPYCMIHATDFYVPRMLVGGANYYSHLNNKPISEFTAKNYEDRFQNYMVNEPAINYTASLSYVLGYFSEFEQNQYKGTQ